MEAALKWLESENDWHRAVIVCDCKSLVEATGNPHQADRPLSLSNGPLPESFTPKSYSLSVSPDTVTFEAMSWRTQKLSGDPLYRNLPSGTLTERPGKR